MSPENSIPERGEGEVIMPEPGEVIAPESTAQFGSLHDQNMAAMGQSMAQFQGNAVTVSKATDYAYLQDKDLVSLTEAVGVREVASRVNPAGPVPATPAG